MMTATKALEVTMQELYEFHQNAMNIIENNISIKLNDAILSSASDLRQTASLYFAKGQYSDFTNTESKQNYFAMYLERYIKEQKYKNVKVEITKNYIEISFSW